MIKAAVFDLDHTLFDRYGTIKAIVPRFRENFRIAPGVTDEFIYNTLSYADKHYVYFGWEKIYAYLCQNGVFSELPGFEVYTRTLLSLFKDTTVKYPFAAPTLNEIREMGLKTGLITNGKHDIQTKKLERLELTDLFDEIIISNDTPYQKPDKEIFLEMSEKLGINPENIMYIGDHPKFDVDGSRKAGFVPVWVKTTGTWAFPEIEKSPYSVNTVAEIPDLIRKLNGDS